MISYSDHVLSQKPWGYWPLNDVSLSQYNENQMLIDCSGNQRNLTGVLSYLTCNVNMPAILHDSLPLKGISVSGSINFGTFPLESKVYYSGGIHTNDVYAPLSSYSHNLWRKRLKAECLTQNGIFMIGGLCITSTSAYHIVQKNYKSGSSWYVSGYPGYQVATYSSGSRYIGDVEWIDNQHIILSIVVDGNIVVNRQSITLPDLDDSTHYTRFYNGDWHNIALLNGTISNFSVFYDKELTQDYVTKSWQSLTNTYIPSVFTNTIELSDNVNRCKIISNLPNTMSSQLDTLLIRGYSQRLFSDIQTEDIGNGHTKVSLMIYSTNIEYGYNRIDLVHDFKLGEIISLDGSSQSINGCWIIDEITETSISFITSFPVNNETGYFIVKRPPVGGGAWSRNSLYEYTSQSSTLNSTFVVDDKSKSGTTISIKSLSNSNVIWKRYLKRDSTHYLGADLGQGRPQWSIYGDDLRFIFTVAYKQNPKTHTHILVFGDILDPNDNQIKTYLEGYVDEKIGNVGSNKIFEFNDFNIIDNGTLRLRSQLNRKVNSGWIISDEEGAIEYIQGYGDNGEHYYPIYLP